MFERLPLANFGNRIPQLSFEVVRPVGRLEQMVRAVTLIPGTTEFGYEPATVVRTLGPGQSAPENRHVTHAPSDVVAALDELQAVVPESRTRRDRGRLVRHRSALRRMPGACRRSTTRSSRPSAGPGRSPVSTARPAQLVSTVDGRPAFGGTPSDQSVRDLIAELKARGLKVTLYPFVMMDIPAGNALPDPWTGAASQPAYPWRGRITCDPAPGQAGSPDGTCGGGDAGRRLLQRRRRRLELSQHGAALRVSLRRMPAASMRS